MFSVALLVFLCAVLWFWEVESLWLWLLGKDLVFVILSELLLLYITTPWEHLESLLCAILVGHHSIFNSIFLLIRSVVDTVIL